MPVYEYICGACGSYREQFAKVEERDINKPKCCGHEMERMISAPAVQAEFTPYRSTVTGEIIDSRTKHRNMLKATGCVEIGDQHKQHQAQLERNKEEKKKKESQALRQEIAARINSIT